MVPLLCPTLTVYLYFILKAFCPHFLESRLRMTRSHIRSHRGRQSPYMPEKNCNLYLGFSFALLSFPRFWLWDLALIRWYHYFHLYVRAHTHCLLRHAHFVFRRSFYFFLFFNHWRCCNVGLSFHSTSLGGVLRGLLHVPEMKARHKHHAESLLPT